MGSNFNKSINVGFDRLVTINQLADAIIGISGKHITKKYDLTAAQGVRGRNADLTLVKKTLSWEPKVSLDSARMV
jgi:nucleoside-diphosphate-sugar epimerase